MPHPTAPMICLQDVPALAAALWDDRSDILSECEVFRLYEERWDYIEPSAMTERERVLLARLTATYGNGVFLG